MSYFRCWAARNLLDLHVDGRLVFAAAARVERHLRACRPCREAAGELGGVQALLRKAPRPAVPRGLEDSVLEALLRAPAGARALPASSGPGGFRLGPAQAAALAALLLLAGSHLWGVPSAGPAGSALRGGSPKP